jgi:hypothetical protein
MQRKRRLGSIGPSPNTESTATRRRSAWKTCASSANTVTSAFISGGTEETRAGTTTTTSGTTFTIAATTIATTTPIRSGRPQPNQFVLFRLVHREALEASSSSVDEPLFCSPGVSPAFLVWSSDYAGLTRHGLCPPSFETGFCSGYRVECAHPGESQAEIWN